MFRADLSLKEEFTLVDDEDFQADSPTLFLSGIFFQLECADYRKLDYVCNFCAFWIDHSHFTHWKVLANI